MQNPDHQKNDFKWASWCLLLPASWLLFQKLIQVNNEETSTLALLALCGGNLPVTGGSPHKHAENVIMTWLHNDESLEVFGLSIVGRFSTQYLL